MSTRGGLPLVDFHAGNGRARPSLGALRRVKLASYRKVVLPQSVTYTPNERAS